MADDFVDNNTLLDAHVDEEFSRSYDEVGDENVPPIYTEQVSPAPDSKDRDKKDDEGNFTQWAIGGNGRFSPVGASIARLKAGIYEPFATPASWGFERLDVTESIIYYISVGLSFMGLRDLARQLPLNS
jgi:hypothetical protein